MFPAFYKNCVIFDLDKYVKTWWELTFLPRVCYFRKYILSLIELLGLSYMYYIERTHCSNPQTPNNTHNLVFNTQTIAEIVVMVFTLVVMNKLSADIYSVFEYGWLNM